MNKDKIINVIIGILFIIIIIIGIFIFIDKIRIEKFNDSTSISEQNENDFDKEYKDVNYFEMSNMTDEQMAEYYFFRYKDDIIYNPKELYDILDNKYKEKKYKDLTTFLNYVNENKEILANVELNKYKVNKKDNHTEYICVDQYGNYYIFDETAVMKYTVRLDTYTIDSDEFLNKYNNGSEQLKVGMNLEKVFQALNRKDYQYIYEKLYPEFRDNNFPTLNKFKAYMQNEFFEVNKITYGKFESKSNTDIYEVYITDAREDEEEADTKKVEKSFILKLEEGTDFVMSFNIQ